MIHPNQSLASLELEWVFVNTLIKFNADGLVPAIVQEATSSNGPHPEGRVLMMAWMNEESIRKSAETGFMHYWSRSRKKLWLKGESSGHKQKIRRWYVDCDGDTLLFEVEQVGGACHTGYHSCFFQELDASASPLPIRETKDFDASAVYHPTP